MAMDAQTHWAIEQIQRYLREGNAAAVIEIGERVLMHDEEDMETFLLAARCLASAYEQLEQWDNAMRWLAQCLAIEPANPTLAAMRGRVLLKMGRVAEAAAVFRDLAKRYPQRSDYHGASGSALLQRGEIEEALPHLKQARELNPADPYILNDLASAYLLQGDLEESLSAFKQATDHIGPGDLELARDIRRSVEEVRATLILRRGAIEPRAEARIADVYPESAAMTPPTIERGAEATAQSDPAAAFRDSRVRAAVLAGLAERSARPRQVLAALHLWSDFLETLPAEKQARVDSRPPSWAAAVVYAIGRLDGAQWARQIEIAKGFGTSPSTLSRCFGRIRRALSLEIGDPRYCTVPSYRRAALIEQIHRGQRPAECLLLR